MDDYVVFICFVFIYIVKIPYIDKREVYRDISILRRSLKMCVVTGSNIESFIYRLWVVECNSWERGTFDRKLFKTKIHSSVTLVSFILAGLTASSTRDESNRQGDRAERRFKKK